MYTTSKGSDGVEGSMTLSTHRARTTGSAQFDPDAFFQAWASRRTLPEGNDLRSAIVTAFNLPSNDHYVYHAIASVTLADVQQAIAGGDQHGLHAWYLGEDGKPVVKSPIQLGLSPAHS